MTRKLTHLQRSRLKVTVVASIFIYLQTFFPMYVIVSASHLEVFELASAWGAWASAISGVGVLIGYYVNKDTQRPSFVNNTIIGMPNNEDHDDPEDIPL